MKVAGAVLQTVASRQVGLVFTAVGTLVLARLLTPEEFGTFAVALALFGIAEELTFFGLEPNLVRDRTFSREKASSSAGLCLAIAAGLVLTASLFTVFTPDGDLATIASLTLVMATALLVKPLTLPIEAALGRDIRFGFLSLGAALMLTVEAGVSVALAFWGWGPMALAAGVLAGRVARAAFLLLARFDLLVLPGGRGWGSLLGFGGTYSASALLPKLGAASSNLIVGPVLGLASLGLYDRARTIVGLLDRTVLDGLKPVVLPAISRSIEGGTPAREVYLQKVDFLAALIWPVYASVAILAAPLVAVVLGDQWEQSVGLVRILCLAGIGVPFARMSVKMFTAIDELPLFLKIQSTFLVCRTLAIAGAAFVSLEAVCWTFSGFLCLKAAVLHGVMERKIDVDMLDLVRRLATAVATALACSAAAVLPLILLSGKSPVVVLGSGIILCSGAWIATLVVSRHPIRSQMTALASSPRMTLKLRTR